MADKIDYECGVTMQAKSGQTVSQGDVIAQISYNDDTYLDKAIKLCEEGQEIL